MDKLFTPELGLMVWTVVTFALLLLVLGRFGWKPMINALEERERRLREERAAAEAARAEARRIQAELEAKLADLEARSREVMLQAARDAEKLRAAHTERAQREAEQILAKTRAELEDERRRLTERLRSEVAGLSLLAAERLVGKSIDEGVRRSVLDEFLQELSRRGGGD